MTTNTLNQPVVAHTPAWQPTMYWLFLLALVCALALAAPANVRAADADADAANEGGTIGRVILSVGDVQAIAADGTVRQLQRRDAVYQGESLRTGPTGRMQIRFVDGARLALRPNTDMGLEEYNYQPELPAANVSNISLRKGGFRKVSGAIGRLNRTAYRVTTPYAVIGIRGTDYGCAFDPDAANPVLVVGSNEGSVVVSNAAGEVVIGDGAPFGFAVVTGANAPPAGTDDPPDDINASMSLDLPAEEDTGGDDAGGGTAAGSGGSGGDIGDEDVGEDGELLTSLDAGGSDDTLMFEYGERCL